MAEEKKIENKDFFEIFKDYCEQVTEYINEQRKNVKDDIIENWFNPVGDCIEKTIENINNSVKEYSEKISSEIDRSVENIDKGLEILDSSLKGKEQKDAKCIYESWFSSVVFVPDVLFSEEDEQTLKRLSKEIKNIKDAAKKKEMQTEITDLEKRKKLYEKAKNIYLNKANILGFFNGQKTKEVIDFENEVDKELTGERGKKTKNGLTSLEKNLIESKKNLEKILGSVKEKAKEIIDEYNKANVFDDKLESLFDEKDNFVLKNFYNYKNFEWAQWLSVDDEGKFSIDENNLDIENCCIKIPFEDFSNESKNFEINKNKNGEIEKIIIFGSDTENGDRKEMSFEKGDFSKDVINEKAKKIAYRYSEENAKNDDIIDIVTLIRIYIILYKQIYKEYMKVNKNIELYNNSFVNVENENSFLKKFENIKTTLESNLSEYDDSPESWKEYIDENWDFIFKKTIDGEYWGTNLKSGGEEEFKNFLKDFVEKIIFNEDGGCIDYLKNLPWQDDLNFREAVENKQFVKRNKNYIVEINKEGNSFAKFIKSANGEFIKKKKDLASALMDNKIRHFSSNEEDKKEYKNSIFNNFKIFKTSVVKSDSEKKTYNYDFISNSVWLNRINFKRELKEEINEFEKEMKKLFEEMKNKGFLEDYEYVSIKQSRIYKFYMSNQYQNALKSCFKAIMKEYFKEDGGK